MLFGKEIVLLFAAIAASQQSIVSPIDSYLKTNIYCRIEQKIVLRNQTLAADFFEDGLEIVSTDEDGVLELNQTLKGKKFRLYGYSGRDIIPGCSSGDIKRLEPGLNITLFGLDCGYVEGCDK